MWLDSKGNVNPPCTADGYLNFLTQVNTWYVDFVQVAAFVQALTADHDRDALGDDLLQPADQVPVDKMQAGGSEGLDDDAAIVFFISMLKISGLKPGVSLIRKTQDLLFHVRLPLQFHFRVQAAHSQNRAVDQVVQIPTEHFGTLADDLSGAASSETGRLEFLHN